MSSSTIAELQARMQAAVEAQDYEEAARLRDQLSILRGAPDADPAEIDTSRLKRQVPGQMGLGTSDLPYTRKPGWKPPKKPDLMTTGVKPAKKR